jgi:hypothetical protein
MSHAIGAHAAGHGGAGAHQQLARHASNGNHSNDWVRLDLRAISALFIAYKTDPVAQACRNAVIARLLSGGILYTKSDFSSLPDDDFNDHINSRFTDFCRQVIDNIYVTGFCPYVIDPEAGVPRVVPYTRADVRVRIDPLTFETQLALFREDDDQPAPDVYFIIQSPPDEFGSLQSAMVCYYEARIFKDMLWRTTAEAESTRARPPIYTTTETDRAFEERRLAHVGEVDGLRASITRDNMLVRNRVIGDVHAQQERLAEMLNASRVDTSDPSYRSDPITGLRNYDADLAQKYSPIIPLPADARVAATPMPVSRPDFVAVNEHLQQIASMAFGVNLEAVGANSANKSSDSMNSANTVTTATVNRFKALLTGPLVDIYHVLWGKKEEGDEPAESVTVMFPSIVSTSTMLILFEKNLLTQKALLAYLHKHLGLPLNSFEKKDYRASMMPSPAPASGGGAFGAGAGGAGGGAGGAGAKPGGLQLNAEIIKLMP